MCKYCITYFFSIKPPFPLLKAKHGLSIQIRDYDRWIIEFCLFELTLKWSDFDLNFKTQIVPKQIKTFSRTISHDTILLSTTAVVASARPKHNDSGSRTSVRRVAPRPDEVHIDRRVSV